ncbi:MAG: hypothetical protein IJT02_07405 [Synergistaceae bacterium]|nr:hypothetical protein [Synergistaceae bacterium]
MFWFNRLKEYVTKLVKPSMYISGMDYVFKLWQESDAKERGILLLTFSPMFLSMGGFVFTIIYFVLFVLPSYLFSVLGWGVLTALFGAGGKYCFKYFTGKELKGAKDSNVIDVSFTDADDEEEEDEPEEEPEASAEPKKRTSRKKSDAQ